MAIPKAKIEDDKFLWHDQYIECWKWTCPTCSEHNYAPHPVKAEDMYIRHVREEHPEQQG